MAIGLFIDGAYAMRAYGLGSKIDYLKLRKHIEAELKDEVVEAYFFNADDNPPAAQQLHGYLSVPYPQGPGFRVKVYWLTKSKLFWPKFMGGGPVVHPTDPSFQYEATTQKAVDVGLVFHMTMSYNRKKWDKLVLIAGDGDFHEPVQNLVEGSNVELYLVGSIRSISSELRSYARRVFEIDKEPLHSELQFQKAVDLTNPI